MIDGYKLNEIADALGQPSSWVSERLEELRSEVVLNSGHFLPLTEQEYEGLKASVEEHGVQTPVLIGEHQLIDGRHRWLVSQELGMKEIPAVFVMGLTADEEHDVAVAVNSARRHLNRKQKRLIIRSELKRGWERSSRSIAAICGVSTTTVEDVRGEMRREAELMVEGADPVVLSSPETFIPPPKEQDMRVSADGILRPSVVESNRQKVVLERMMGYAPCGACGAMLTVYRIGEEYRLVHDHD